MKQLLRRCTRRLHCVAGGLMSFAVLALCTLALIGLTRTPAITAPNTATPVTADGIKLSGQLSRGKLLQGGDGTVYVHLEIAAPAQAERNGMRRATDLVVVLDKSGSMSAENRLPYAKQAVLDLVQRLGAEDRLGLVLFDSVAELVSDLQPMTDAQRARLRLSVSAIQAGSGTNLSEGLFKARTLFLEQPSERNRALLLLSDGEANEGITLPEGLNGIARGIGEQGVVLSTIGMGLGFNEVLMASLADHGMGSYAYLEHLGGLAEILARPLDESRQVYAQRSELAIRLPPGVALIDAGGYERTRVSASSVRVPAGQILAGARRNLTLTFKVATDTLGERELTALTLHYHTARGDHTAGLQQAPLRLAVVPAERREEAAASVNEPVLKSSWISNNLGRLKAAYREAVAAGKRDEAKATLDRYVKDVRGAEAELGLSIVDAATAAQVEDMARDLDDAFSGAPAERTLKQQRLAKKAHAEGLKAQRASK
ncbi:MAG: vWA domain-containing protein [Gammaproteobacteria bacterium]